jgi:hypothetical protein
MKETTITTALRAQADALRVQANILEALALASAGGKDNDLLKASEIQELLHCGRTKACEILRAHGTGAGRMARIDRGKLMDLQRKGQL